LWCEWFLDQINPFFALEMQKCFVGNEISTLLEVNSVEISFTILVKNLAFDSIFYSTKVLGLQLLVKFTF